MRWCVIFINFICSFGCLFVRWMISSWKQPVLKQLVSKQRFIKQTDAKIRQITPLNRQTLISCVFWVLVESSKLSFVSRYNLNILLQFKQMVLFEIFFFKLLSIDNNVRILVHEMTASIRPPENWHNIARMERWWSYRECSKSTTTVCSQNKIHNAASFSAEPKIRVNQLQNGEIKIKISECESAKGKRESRINKKSANTLDTMNTDSTVWKPHTPLKFWISCNWVE